MTYCTAIEKLEECAMLWDASNGSCFSVYQKDEKKDLEKWIKRVYHPDTTNTMGLQYSHWVYKYYRGDTEEFLSDVVDRIWHQSKYTDGVLRIQLIHIALVDKDIKNPRNTSNFSLRHLFRVMKCVDPETQRYFGRCMTFVDEFGLIYESWGEFKSKNAYSKAIIVAPKNGWYHRLNGEDYEMEEFFAPVCSDFKFMLDLWIDFKAYYLIAYVDLKNCEPVKLLPSEVKRCLLERYDLLPSCKRMMDKYNFLNYLESNKLPVGPIKCSVCNGRRF